MTLLKKNIFKKYIQLQFDGEIKIMHKQITIIFV